MKNLSVVILLIFSISVCSAQQSVPSILDSIFANNKTLQAERQFWEAQKIGYRTGITLPNPVVEYDYMAGTPSSAGNQRDLNILQAFDFPTSYLHKRSLADEQAKQAEYQLRINRQEILSQAQIFLLELVYLNKSKNELNNRLSSVSALSRSMEERLKKGDANILDLNKTRLQKIRFETELRKVEAERNIMVQKLTELNGGKAVVFHDSIYPALPSLPDFVTLEDQIEKQDPHLKFLEQQKKIVNEQISLARSLRLPKFETGYHSQAILGQSYKGAHFAVSIPLWENRNTVNLQQANQVLTSYRIEEHKTSHYHEVQQEYENYQNLLKTFSEYSVVIESINSNELLLKALNLGEISLVQYFMESGYFYEAFDQYRMIQKELHQSVARLNKYNF